jgi:hypothetical protein
MMAVDARLPTGRRVASVMARLPLRGTAYTGVLVLRALAGAAVLDLNPALLLLLGGGLDVFLFDVVGRVRHVSRTGESSGTGAARGDRGPGGAAGGDR